MADVSARLQADAGTEIVLNLSLLQAIRLVEAIAGRAADTMSRAGIRGDARWPDALEGGLAAAPASPAGPAKMRDPAAASAAPRTHGLS